MKILIGSYKVAGILLVVIESLLLLLIIGNELSRGRIIQYAEKYPNVGDEFFYPVIYYGEVLIYIIGFVWILLTLILIIDRKFRITSIISKIGIVGFIGSIIYKIFDPFGLGAYYFD